MSALEHRHGSYLISDDPARLDVDAIHAFLVRSHWGEGIPHDVVARSVANSLGLGPSKAAMRLYTTHPKLQNIRRHHLVTPDVHGLYAQFGFSVVAQPERHMEKRDPDAYRRATVNPPS